MSALVIPASIFNTLGSDITSAVSTVASVPLKAAAKVGLSTVSTFIVAGAEAMLHELVTVISAVTAPSLSVSWFSDSYWRVSGLAMLLTVPFLFAAAVQAVVRSDMGVLIRAAFFDLPIAAISVTLAAPLITLLLAATDEMCTLVTGSGAQGAGFLELASSDLGRTGGGFMLMVIAVVMLLAGLALAVELILRSAAIYIVVLFLPLGFAAMVWPARRVWIKRMIELLIALILSKFAMVAILSLAVAGLTSVSTGGASVTTALSAMALMILAALSPWALLRLLPFTELAAGASVMLNGETRTGVSRGLGHAPHASDVAAGLTVDPVVAGVNALRSFVSGGATAGSERRGQGSGQTSLTGGRAEALQPRPDARRDSAQEGSGSRADHAGDSGPLVGEDRGGGPPVSDAKIAPVGSANHPVFADPSAVPLPVPGWGTGSSSGPAAGSSSTPDRSGAEPPAADTGPVPDDGVASPRLNFPMRGPRPEAVNALGPLGPAPLRREPVGSVHADSPVLDPHNNHTAINLANPADGFLVGLDPATVSGADSEGAQGSGQ